MALQTQAHEGSRGDPYHPLAQAYFLDICGLNDYAKGTDWHLNIPISMVVLGNAAVINNGTGY